MLSPFAYLLLSSSVFATKARALENSSPLALYSLWPGSPSSVPLPGPWDQEPLPAFRPPAAETASTNQAIFIRLKLSLKTKKNLKDSLIDLGTETGFRPDARFDPVVDGQEQKAFVWGWLSPSRISQMTRFPAVEKISFSDHRRGKIPMNATESLIVGLKVDSSISKTLSKDLPRLIHETGFKIQKTIGYQPIPQSDKIAILFLGQIPISDIDRLLNQPYVVKVLPLMPKSKGDSFRNVQAPSPKSVSLPEKLTLWGGALGLVLGCLSFYLLFLIRKKASS